MQNIKAGDVKHIPGYFVSSHRFGRSELLRQGNEHYIKWQWTKYNTDLDMISLTRQQYKDIKEMLIPSWMTSIKLLSTISDKIITFHPTDSQTYMRIKRYLIKNKILKEN